jgi:23S rRNA-/tRNA-specific pseudouridylate synthase
VLAKTKEAVRSLNRQLKFKKIHKEYLALVVGEIRPQGSIRLSLQKQMDRSVGWR